MSCKYCLKTAQKIVADSGCQGVINTDAYVELLAKFISDPESEELGQTIGQRGAFFFSVQSDRLYNSAMRNTNDEKTQEILKFYRDAPSITCREDESFDNAFTITDKEYIKRLLSQKHIIIPSEYVSELTRGFSVIPVDNLNNTINNCVSIQDVESTVAEIKHHIRVTIGQEIWMRGDNTFNLNIKQYMRKVKARIETIMGESMVDKKAKTFSEKYDSQKVFDGLKRLNSKMFDNYYEHTKDNFDGIDETIKKVDEKMQFLKYFPKLRGMIVSEVNDFEFPTKEKFFEMASWK